MCYLIQCGGYCYIGGISFRSTVSYFAVALAWAVFTVVFSSSMTFSGSGALKMAVPATMTLLPEKQTG